MKLFLCFLMIVTSIPTYGTSVTVQEKFNPWENFYQAYQKANKDPQKFINSPLLNLNTAERKYLKKNWLQKYKIKKLPELVMFEDTLQFRLPKKKTLTVQIVSLDKSLFNINGKILNFRSRKTLPEVLEYLEKIKIDRTITFLDYLIPNAYGFMLMGGFLAVAAITAVGVAIYRSVGPDHKCAKREMRKYINKCSKLRRGVEKYYVKVGQKTKCEKVFDTYTANPWLSNAVDFSPSQHYDLLSQAYGIDDVGHLPLIQLINRFNKSSLDKNSLVSGTKRTIDKFSQKSIASCQKKCGKSFHCKKIKTACGSDSTSIAKLLKGIKFRKISERSGKGSSTREY